MTNNLKFRILKKIYFLTAFFLFYVVIGTCIPIPLNLRSINKLEIESNLRSSNENDNKKDPYLIDKMLEDKINIDLVLHNMQSLRFQTNITQFNLNKEGKILGYKPYNLKVINYSLEVPINNLIKKDTLIVNNYSNIYWLNLKLK
uniref:Uncharacterized protein n=1 Tax=Storeatula sp. CCMP1868 TaxID=195070 RepID=A0A222AHL9_9CRYP|nr:hypothetical protein [Storeatula sp. CCMP1868]